MADYDKLRVTPLAPEPLHNYELKRIREDSKPDLSGLGCVVIIVLVLVGLTLLGSQLQTRTVEIQKIFSVLGILAVISGGAMLFLYFGIRDSRYEKKVAERRSEELAKRAEQAKDASTQAREALKTSTRTFKELPGLLLQARKSLERADVEFHARAFGPFWDAIEEGARHLDDYYRSVSQITNSAKRYYHLLQGYKHNFPSLRAEIENPPSPMSIVGDLQAAARRAQSDFEFASIWEHRQTRKVLIAGFEHLGDALYNIGDVLSDAIANLEDTLRFDIAKAVEQQAGAREETRMADVEKIKILKEVRDR